MRSYLLTIIWTMLFVVIVEMIFPVSELKKYLKLVLSFIVLVVIASPLVTLLTQQQWVETTRPMEYIAFYQEQFEGGRYVPYEEEKKKQEESVKQVYKDQVESQMKLLIEAKLPIEVSQITSEVTLNGSHIGISEMQVVVTPLASESFLNIWDKSESVVLSDEHLKNEIKKCINDFYNVDNANIYITVQDS
ncbi:MAG: stage III sporulation protein AF [Niameybacter sp.]